MKMNNRSIIALMRRYTFIQTYTQTPVILYVDQVTRPRKIAVNFNSTQHTATAAINKQSINTTTITTTQNNLCFNDATLNSLLTMHLWKSGKHDNHKR